jgi:alpha-L-fucosidase
VVLKLTNVQPGMTPPVVSTTGARPELGAVILEGSIGSLGKADAVDAGFQYRPRKGMTDLYEKTEPWREAPYVKRTETGSYTVRLSGIPPGSYEYRAVVKHPLITVYGHERPFVLGGK